MNRVTVIVPVSKAEAANHTHIALGKAKDLNSYSEPNYQDAQGNLYHVSSGLWTEAQIAGVKNPLIMSELVLPENSKADMAQISTAQFLFELWEPTGEVDEVVPKVSPTKILSIVVSDPISMLVSLGLSHVHTEAFSV